MFFLKLRLPHNMTVAFIPSSSSNIVECLTNEQIDRSLLNTIFMDDDTLSNPSHIHALGHYLDFHKEVQNKIKQILRSNVMPHNFEVVCIECTRPVCENFNVFSNPKEGDSVCVTCTKCKIEKFCLKCTSAYHDDDCDQIEASPQLILDNIHNCPRCLAQVEKNGGSNDMSCRCGIYFCWLCNMQYEHNKISDHYFNMDTYGRCRGQIN